MSGDFGDVAVAQLCTSRDKAGRARGQLEWEDLGEKEI